ncbi:ABC transporter permease [Solirubrobacter sp. CPCC 204708]|uniref:ABC transporter permease n=1 Tax=Solirubrobacter deserti TaxID=2282478 RepID=A0ABT4RBV9_9ACTN|nr:ABC transporter permease [Solirubrobacter deserti]MBE2317085.1 ABC transporter permease [Solirubrobacter deserti]MDA0136023.1 ABC transporter permease [Solirubrobacter deserti]
MHRILASRLAALVATVVVATALAHVLFATSLHGVALGAAVREIPGFLADTFLRGEFGDSSGGGCGFSREGTVDLCATYGAAPVGEMLRERGLVDLQLLIGGLLIGTLIGLAAGRRAAARPETRGTRVIHALVVFLLSCPPYFLGFAVLVYFAWSSGELALPFVSGQGDYVPFGEDPLGFLKAIWAPWILVALPLAAFVARMTEAALREVLDEDFIRTARAKGLAPGRVLNRHALPAAAPPIAALTGVNVSTMLINAAAIEYGFGLPGMFPTLRAAINVSDAAVLQAIVLEGVVLVVIANFLADAFQARLDPRVR